MYPAVETNLPIIGMDLDSSVYSIKPGWITYGLNGTFKAFGESNQFQSQLSNLLKDHLKSGYQLIGYKLIDTGFLIWSTNNTSSELGLFNDAYTTINNNTCWNFNTGFPIKAVFKKTSCSRKTYWQDTRNPDRVLDLDNLPFDCSSPTPVFDCNKTLLFPLIGNPCFVLDSCEETGNLLSGAYQLSIQFADSNGGELTGFYCITNPIPVNRDTATSINTAWGSAPNTPTSKSIKFHINNLPTEFSYINLGIIESHSGVLKARVIKSIQYTTVNSLVHTFTGYEPYENASLDDIVTERKIYRDSGTLDNNNDYLMLGNLREYRKFNFQSLVTKNLGIQYRTKRIDYRDVQKSYKNPIECANSQGYLRDEVYALSIRLIMKNGEKSCPYHIPGRTKNHKADHTPIPINQTDVYGTVVPVWDDSMNGIAPNNLVNGTETQRWQVLNTATIGSVNCLDGVDGETSYYEVQQGNYPSDDCGNQLIDCITDQPIYPQGKIRHHKMPDCHVCPLYPLSETNTFSFLANSQWAHDFGGNNFGYIIYNQYDIHNTDFQGYVNAALNIDILGLNLVNYTAFLNDINFYYGTLPEYIENPIIGYEILRGDRNGQKTIIAKGQYYKGRLYESDTSTGSSTTTGLFPNYPFNYTDTHNTSMGNTNTIVDWNYNPAKLQGGAINTAFHAVSRWDGTIESPDLSFNKPILNTNSLKIEQSNYGIAECQYKSVKDFQQVTKNAVASNLYNPALMTENLGIYKEYDYIGALIGNGYSRFNFKTKENFYAPTNGYFYKNNATYDINTAQTQSTCYVSTVVQIPDNLQKEGTTIKTFGDHYYDGANTLASTQGFDPWFPLISSYYVSIKNNDLSIQSDLYSINYIPCHNSCTNGNCPIILGGDTFLNFYYTRRKHGFFRNYPADWGFNFIDDPSVLLFDFTETRPHINDNGDVKNGAGALYNYWTFDNSGGAGKELFFTYQSSSVIGFFCESSTNTDLRYYEQTQPESWFYPKFDLDFYLNQSILQNNDWYIRDNIWLDSIDNAKQNFDVQPCLLNTDCSCQLNTYEQRVIYSNPQQSESLEDAWLIFLPLNYYDFDKSSGKLVDLRPFQQDKFLFRFQDCCYVNNAFEELKVGTTTVTIGTGAMFNQKPKKLVTSEQGYCGTNSKFAFSSNEYGALMIDEQRAKMFLFNETLTDLTKNNINNWAIDNIPLNLTQQFPYNPDNPYNSEGIGYICTYDNQNDVFYITKKDYTCINLEEIQYLNGSFYDPLRNPISLKNQLYFKDLSWTISYSPQNNAFQSFHSFIPDAYLQGKKNYNTYKNNSFYEHNYNSSCCTYYGSTYDFIVEVVNNPKSVESNVRSVKFKTRSETLQPSPYQERYSTFDRAYLYTTEECSGLLNLIVPDPTNLSTILNLPITNLNSIDIPITLDKGNTWGFTDFRDLTKDRTLPTQMFTLNPSPSIDKDLNPSYLNYNKEWFDKAMISTPNKVRLFFNDSTHKLIYELGIIKNTNIVSN